jgi:hypothetical protein
MLAFDRALDSVAPVIAKVAIGQLFQAIYSDSDVIYSTPKLRDEKTLVIYWAGAPLVEQIVERLKSTGASASPGTGMSESASRFKLETEMDDFDLYEWFNAQSFTVGGKTYKTPVVAYSENVIEVEAVAQQSQPRRQPIGKAPPRQPKKSPASTSPSARPGQQGPGGDQLAKVTLRLRPAQFNR